MRSLCTVWPILGLFALSLPMPVHAHGPDDGLLGPDVVLAPPMSLPPAPGFGDGLGPEEMAPPPPCGEMPPPPLFEAGMPPPDRVRPPEPPRFPPPPRLSETQRDQVFAIVYPLEPKFRELTRTIGKTRAALNELVTSERYDEAEARALADTYARAVADLVVLRAQVAHRIRGVLDADAGDEAAPRRSAPGFMGRPPRPE